VVVVLHGARELGDARVGLGPPSEAQQAVGDVELEHLADRPAEPDAPDFLAAGTMIASRPRTGRWRCARRRGLLMLIAMSATWLELRHHAPALAQVHERDVEVAAGVASRQRLRRVRMADHDRRSWLDRIREWRAARRQRAVERRRHRSDHQRAMERAGKSTGGSQYYDSEHRGGGG
jgi:hypothetical protein